MTSVFLTGITGLVGRAVARRLLRADPRIRIYAPLRNPLHWPRTAAALGGAATRVIPFRGDITRPQLGIDAAALRVLRRDVRVVIHCAADTTFSRPLAQARAVNTLGTAHVLDIAAGWDLERFVHVSTAFVAGARSGPVAETALDDAYGFVNAYEQSKWEAEARVRAAGVPCVILRPSTIVCDDASGAVTQLNAVHRALRVYRAGLAALMPGTEDTPVDLVTNQFVADAIADLAVGRAAAGGTYHLCAGAGALPLGELLDRAHAAWSRDESWTRRGIVRPALTDLDTYRLFERSVAETGDPRLRAITRSLSHFVPQLALPKQFVTHAAAAALGRSAPPVAAFWDAAVRQLAETRWGQAQGRAA